MKNLKSHQTRNTKTAMMFVIALAFLIFAGCVFELMGVLIITQVEATMGGVDLYSTALLSKISYLDEGRIRSYLDEQDPGDVVGYTFASTDLNDLLRNIAPDNNVVRRIRFGTACGYSQSRVRLYSV